MPLREIAALPWPERLAVYAGMVLAGLCVLGVMATVARNPRVRIPALLILLGALALAAGSFGWTGSEQGQSQAVLWGGVMLAAGVATLWLGRRRKTK